MLSRTRHADPAVGRDGRQRTDVWDDHHDATTPQRSLLTESTIYRTIRCSAYENVIDDALDELAVKAVRLSFQSGRFHDDPTTPQDYRDAIRGMADGVSFRLRERAGAYEQRLRMTYVPELDNGNSGQRAS